MLSTDLLGLLHSEAADTLLGLSGAEISLTLPVECDIALSGRAVGSELEVSRLPMDSPDALARRRIEATCWGDRLSPSFPRCSDICLVVSVVTGREGIILLAALGVFVGLCVSEGLTVSTLAAAGWGPDGGRLVIS